jgi:hypothetical protein
MPPSANCPKCGRALAPDGEFSVNGGPAIPYYQCPECVTRANFLGDRVEFPLTFVIGPDGKAYDPGNPDGAIDMTEYD